MLLYWLGLEFTGRWGKQGMVLPRQGGSCQVCVPPDILPFHHPTTVSATVGRNEAYRYIQCAVCSLRLISIAAQDPTRPSLRYPTPKRGPPKNLAVSEIRTNGRFKSCKPDKSDYRSIGGIDPKDMRNSYSKIACTRTVAISQRSQPNCVEANRIQQTGSGRDPLSGLRLPDVRHGKMGFLSLSITPR